MLANVHLPQQHPDVTADISAAGHRQPPLPGSLQCPAATAVSWPQTHTGNLQGKWASLRLGDVRGEW